jgi:hypothetical protein
MTAAPARDLLPREARHRGRHRAYKGRERAAVKGRRHDRAPEPRRLFGLGPQEKITDPETCGSAFWGTPAVNSEPAEQMICVENDPDRTLTMLAWRPASSNMTAHTLLMIRVTS